MSKSYFWLIFILLLTIVGISLFAYWRAPKPQVKKPAVQPKTQTIAPKTDQSPTIKTDTKLKIAQPLDGAESSSAFISVDGQTDLNTEVSVNNKDLMSDLDGKFHTTLILEEGENPIIITANTPQGENVVWTGTVTHTPTVETKISTISALVTQLPPVKLKGTLSKIVGGVFYLKIQGSTYEVSVNNKTKYLSLYGSKLAIKDYSPNQNLYLVGDFQNEEKTKVNARLIRNLDIKTHHSTKTSKLTLVAKNNLQTQDFSATLTSDITITDRSGNKITWGYLRPGDTVKISGVFDPTSKIFTLVSEIVNMSLPILEEEASVSSQTTR